MRIKLNSHIVVLALMLGVSGCAATSSQRSAGETVDDSVLTTRVKAALVGNEQTKARQINVETFRGEVQLNGFVDSSAASAAAVNVAKGVPGVVRVKNNLQVGGDRTAGEVVDDVTIATRVKTALIGDSRTKASQVEVDVHEGVVQLGGFVDSTQSRTAAGEVAAAVSGVKSVTNRIEIRR